MATNGNMKKDVFFFAQLFGASDILSEAFRCARDGTSYGEIDEPTSLFSVKIKVSRSKG